MPRTYSRYAIANDRLVDLQTKLRAGLGNRWGVRFPFPPETADKWEEKTGGGPVRYMSLYVAQKDEIVQFIGRSIHDRLVLPHLAINFPELTERTRYSFDSHDFTEDDGRLFLNLLPTKESNEAILQEHDIVLEGFQHIARKAAGTLDDTCSEFEMPAGSIRGTLSQTAMDNAGLILSDIKANPLEIEFTPLFKKPASEHLTRHQ